MSKDSDFDARGWRKLLEDLEAIRTLLGDYEARANTEAIPMRREAVDPEDAAVMKASPAHANQQRSLFDSGEFANRLLDGDWAESRARILTDARASADALGRDETRRREQELRLREAVAKHLAPRMEQLLSEAINELHVNMLRVIRRELDALVGDVFGDTRGAGQNKDQGNPWRKPTSPKT